MIVQNELQIGKAIHRAAEKLSEGWVITINVFKGAASVSLFIHGEDVGFSSSEKSLDGLINEATSYAIAVDLGEVSEL